MDPVDELLFLATLIEGSLCLACAFMVLLVVPFSHHHAHRLTTHLAMFAVAAIALVLTAALADCYHRLKHERDSGK